MRKVRLTLGIFAWIAAMIPLWHAVQKAREPNTFSPSLTSEMWTYASGPRAEATLKLTEQSLVGVGDPIFVADESAGFRQIGEIRRLEDGGQSNKNYAYTTRCEALFYAGAPPLDENTELAFYETPDSLAWVAETMLPPEKRRQVAEKIGQAYRDHHEEIFQTLRPVVEQALRDAGEVVQQDLAKSIKRRQGEFENLGAKYREEIIEKELVPLVKDEIWPIVRRHGEPVANDVGREIWSRAPKFNLAMRYAYDRSIFPQKDLFRQRWQEFVDEDVVPVLEGRTEEIIAAQQKIVLEVAENKKVREAVRKSASKVFDDPELQDLVWAIAKETIIENPRLRETLDRHFRSDEARQALEIAAARLEPTVREIGDMLFGSDESGISPEFAMVLRNQILFKDRRWFVLRPSQRTSDEPRPADPKMELIVRCGERPAANPYAALESPPAPPEDALSAR